MLPFLKSKKVSGPGLIVTHRKPDEPNHQEEHGVDEGLIEAAKDLLRAINDNNDKAIAAAFKAAFQICESLPEEAPEVTYDGQNEISAKEMER